MSRPKKLLPCCLDINRPDLFPNPHLQKYACDPTKNGYVSCEGEYYDTSYFYQSYMDSKYYKDIPKFLEKRYNERDPTQKELLIQNLKEFDFEATKTFNMDMFEYVLRLAYYYNSDEILKCLTGTKYYYNDLIKIFIDRSKDDKHSYKKRHYSILLNMLKYSIDKNKNIFIKELLITVLNLKHKSQEEQKQTEKKIYEGRENTLYKLAYKTAQRTNPVDTKFVINKLFPSSIITNLQRNYKETIKYIPTDSLDFGWLMVYAIKQQNMAALYCFLEAGVDPNENAVNSAFASTPLIAAIEKSNRILVRDLLEIYNADPNQPNTMSRNREFIKNNYTPLSYAAFKPELVELLIKNGVDHNNTSLLFHTHCEVVKRAFCSQKTSSVSNLPYTMCVLPIISEIFKPTPYNIETFILQFQVLTVLLTDPKIKIDKTNDGVKYITVLFESGILTKNKELSEAFSKFYNSFIILFNQQSKGGKKKPTPKKDKTKPKKDKTIPKKDTTIPKKDTKSEKNKIPKKDTTIPKKDTKPTTKKPKAI